MDPAKAPWSVTVTTARYGGIYEGGRWLAFRATPSRLPDEAFGGDTVAAGWWETSGDQLWVGRGSTPQEAFDDLVERWRHLGCQPVSASGRSRSQVQMGGLAARRAEGVVASNHNVAGQASIRE